MHQRRREPGPTSILIAAFWPFAGAMLLLLLLGNWADAERRSWPMTDILAAIRQVETGDRENAPDGDGGLAIGPYQIHYVYWLDATASDASIGGRYEDCRKRGYATKVVEAYFRRYAAAASKRGEAETLARIHNGGPRGHLIRATRGYWQRVRKLLPS